jgi:hypothetical protein
VVAPKERLFSDNGNQHPAFPPKSIPSFGIGPSFSDTPLDPDFVDRLNGGWYLYAGRRPDLLPSLGDG